MTDPKAKVKASVEATKKGARRLEHEIARGMPRWPATVAALAIGGIYTLLSDRLMLGPRGFVLGLVAALLIPLTFARLRGLHQLTRVLAMTLSAAVTAAVAVSAIFLLTRLPGKNVLASTLLRDGALLWVTNVLVFALWYWEIDSGGPAKRSRDNFRSTDFLFPQMALEQGEECWAPLFVDYLFLAFNTSTAFSPTDTMILSRRAKLLMMTQSLISLMVVTVLVARAINIL